jgi:hypothetical protein
MTYQDLLTDYETKTAKANLAIDAHAQKTTEVRYYLKGTEDELEQSKAEKFAAMRARDEAYDALRAF